ncbi:MAG: hypothetical protein ACOC53_07115 [Candidatus Saliniplasma sp.]
MEKSNAVCPKCGTNFEIELDTDSKDCPFCEKYVVFGEMSKH